jgi:broad specificity polyphosphatase/5'/3'-nucleotidase SurE
VSQGFASSFDYSTAARLTTLILDAFRHRYEKGTAPARTINVNVPSCQTGSVRGVRLLPLGQTSRVGSYTVQSGSIDNGTFAPVVVNQNAIATSDCASTLTRYERHRGVQQRLRDCDHPEPGLHRSIGIQRPHREPLGGDRPSLVRN